MPDKILPTHGMFNRQKCMNINGFEREETIITAEHGEKHSRWGFPCAALRPCDWAISSLQNKIHRRWSS